MNSTASSPDRSVLICRQLFCALPAAQGPGAAPAAPRAAAGSHTRCSALLLPPSSGRDRQETCLGLRFIGGLITSTLYKVPQTNSAWPRQGGHKASPTAKAVTGHQGEQLPLGGGCARTESQRQLLGSLPSSPRATGASGEQHHGLSSSLGSGVKQPHSNTALLSL